MKRILAAMIFLSLIILQIETVISYQDVGGNFGTSWLNQYGSKPSMPNETAQSLWNWGTAPKGFLTLNGTLYPPGYWPQYYYPSDWTGATPIVINNTKSNNFISPLLPESNSYPDGWLVSQLSGRPVIVKNSPRSTLF